MSETKENTKSPLHQQIFSLVHDLGNLFTRYIYYFTNLNDLTGWLITELRSLEPLDDTNKLEGVKKIGAQLRSRLLLEFQEGCNSEPYVILKETAAFLLTRDSGDNPLKPFASIKRQGIVNALANLACAHKERIGITYVIPKCMPEIRIDFLSLMRVLINFIVNAIEAHSKNIIFIFELEGEKILLTVADDGDGISEDCLPHILEDNFSTKGENRGFGLGSVICLCSKKLSGTLEVKSEVGIGTVFTIKFPIGRPTQSSKNPEDSRQKCQTSIHTPFLPP
ncbi:ATP-binding protein [Patescibacteria group bacterium]|nr:ATP-binding protein [Patescibacteria group bacterium]